MYPSSLQLYFSITPYQHPQTGVFFYGQIYSSTHYKSQEKLHFSYTMRLASFADAVREFSAFVEWDNVEKIAISESFTRL
jgi:hypothetical protein